MKKLIFLASLLVFLGACSQHEDFTPDLPETAMSDPYTGTAHDIYVNVLTNHFGGYHKNKPNTRAEGAFSITPYIEEGDTLMYIVQYDKGWELYSASKASNMLLFSSEEGRFNINASDMPSALRTLIEIECEKVKTSKKSDLIDVDSSWNFTSLSEGELKNGEIILNNKGVQSTVTYEDVPPGTWVLIGTEVISETFDISSRTTSTTWNQTSPWNEYAKRVYNSKNQIISAPAGCSPVAISQYMYKTHYKDGVPKNCVTTATLSADKWYYTFSGSSSTIWDRMAVDSSNPELCTQSAILIGYVGSQLNSSYRETGTYTTLANEIQYLNSIYGVTFSNAAFDYSYVKTCIDKGYPILASATISEIGTTEGHRFLIDRYSTRQREIKYTYGLERDPVSGNETDPWDDERDEEGNIIGYAYTKEVYRTDVTDGIYMNWGDEPGYNEVRQTPTSSYWAMGNITFKYNHSILKRSDIK